MGRSNGEFDNGLGALPLHLAPASARASIEKNGLKKSDPQTESPDGSMQPKGVYFWHNARGMIRGADNALSSFEGHDIWQLSNPHPYRYIQDASFDRGVALSATSNVKRQDVTRVGHIRNGEVHWHPEEQCNG